MQSDDVSFKKVIQTGSATVWDVLVGGEYVALITKNDDHDNFRVYARSRLRVIGEFGSLKEAKDAAQTWWLENQSAKRNQGAKNRGRPAR